MLRKKKNRKYDEIPLLFIAAKKDVSKNENEKKDKFFQTNGPFPQWIKNQE